MLTKNIEEAYQMLNQTINKIGALGDIVNEFKKSTQEIVDNYISTIEPSKMGDLRENSKKMLQTMIEDISSIDNALSKYDIVEHQLNEHIVNFQVKLNNFEQTLQSTKKIMQDMDTKLLKLIKEAEKNQQTAQKRFTQASQLFAATIEIEKYDELLKISNENKKLLLKLLDKDNLPKPNRPLNRR